MRPDRLGALAGEIFGEHRVRVVPELPDAVDVAAGLADAVASLERRLAEIQACLDELGADVERQRREKKELDIEIAIRKGTLELLGKEPGADPKKPGQPREGRPRQTDQ